MFGTNERVGHSYFTTKGEFNEGKLLVTSMFYTLQGEGPYSGRPAVFIRMAKCLLACSWCDTYFDSGDWMTPEEVLDKAISLIPNDLEPSRVILVLTGGEPMLQQKNLKALYDTPFYLTQVETCGAVKIDLPDEGNESARPIIVCSPKCLEKDGKSVRYLNIPPTNLNQVDYFKFVMCDDPTSPHYYVPDWVLENPKWVGNVFVSPMNIYKQEPQQAKIAREGGTSMEQRSTVEEIISFWEPDLLDLKANERNHKYAANYALKHGLVFNLQTHLYAGLA